MAGNPRRPGRRAILASAVLHGLLMAGAIALSVRARAEVPEFEVYRVSIISPAPQVQGPPQPVTTTAEPEALPPEPEVVEPKPAPKQAPKPEPQKVEKKPTPPAPQQTEKPKQKEQVAASGKKPDPKSQGGEGLNVDIEGVTCPSPEYCENVIRQANRYFRWDGPALTSLIYFVIQRDGSVEDIRTLQSSGNVRFDFAVESAIEAAGGRRAFGPLPAAFGRDQLPMQLRFTPPG